MFQIELAKNYGVPEWREDLKKVMMKAGLENNPMVFLFSDTQVNIKWDSKITILTTLYLYLSPVDKLFDKPKMSTACLVCKVNTCP